MLTGKLQGAPVGLGCQVELIFCFLYLTQRTRRQDVVEDIPEAG